MFAKHLISHFGKVSNALKISIRNCHYIKAKTLNMADVNFSGMSLDEIIKRLETFAPLHLAEAWDNVGLLVDPMENMLVKQILLTNDLTEDVVNEAVTIEAGLIVSYHPNIFQGLKSVSSRTWKERIVVNCIKNRIAVFSPHTCWDAVQGGVNDWLASIFQISSCDPINKNADNPSVGAGRICCLKNPVGLQQIIKNIKSHINIPHIRLALAKGKSNDDLITTVALCAGSGNSVLKGVKADLYLTGEMLHHDILDATQNGIHVILCNHSDSERGFLKDFQLQLQRQLLQDNVGVSVSNLDCDPLKTV